MSYVRYVKAECEPCGARTPLGAATVRDHRTGGRAAVPRADFTQECAATGMPPQLVPQCQAARARGTSMQEFIAKAKSGGLSSQRVPAMASSPRSAIPTWAWAAGAAVLLGGGIVVLAASRSNVRPVAPRAPSGDASSEQDGEAP